MQKSGINRIRTALLVLMLIFTVFSVVFSVSESNHNCTDNDCPVCWILNAVQSNLKLLVLISSTVFVSTRFCFHSFSRSLFKDVSVLNSNTLFSLKIRLND